MNLDQQLSVLINNYKTGSSIMNRITKLFTGSVLKWFDRHGRKQLPWQDPYHPYRVWISEIMLQQTQVSTVIPYFLKFLQRYPSVQELADASLDDVLALWSGLGYYSRARNLHQTAQKIVHLYGGNFPQEAEHLEKLPGIGPSTAAAIAALAFEKPTAILDGNVKRVLSRYFLIPGHDRIYEKKLWDIAKACMPQQNCRAYTQAIMDMGAMCCTAKRPQCSVCPLKNHCQAFQNNVVEHFPEPKPKKIRPIQTEQFLLLHTPNHDIYFEQRIQTGIWEGLWCLPTLKRVAELNLPDQSQLLIAFKHSFTHFHLNIQAHMQASSKINTYPGIWIHPTELKNYGLPKPMQRIIDEFGAKIQSAPHVSAKSS